MPHSLQTSASHFYSSFRAVVVTLTSWWRKMNAIYNILCAFVTQLVLRMREIYIYNIQKTNTVLSYLSTSPYQQQCNSLVCWAPKMPFLQPPSLSTAFLTAPLLFDNGWYAVSIRIASFISSGWSSNLCQPPPPTLVSENPFGQPHESIVHFCAIPMLIFQCVGMCFCCTHAN